MPKPSEVSEPDLPGSDDTREPASRADREGYRIGTVAALTGLDPHTIRAWERRHGAVQPWRSERGTRLYGDAAIERLQLLKALVECGEPIRKVAPLSDGVLRERLQQLAGLTLHGESEAESGGPVLGIGLLSPTVGMQLACSARGLPGFRVDVHETRLEGLVERLRRRPCDVLVLDLEELGSEPIRALDACIVTSRARLVVILYAFARRGLLKRLSRRGARLVRGPLGLDQLQRALTDLVNSDRGSAARVDRPREPVAEDAEPTPEGRFGLARLARISEMSTAIDCECPQHLSSLVRGLMAFEAYSRDCESRDPEDASMHRRLAVGTARARGKLEDLLEALCTHEGLDG